MTLFYSISQYPGKTGSYYYNAFFKKLNIDAEYIPLGANPENFEQILNSVKDTAVGISISMPYKHTVLNYLNEKSLDVLVYSSCNTILRSADKLLGYNTDIAGVIAATAEIKYYKKILILGNGSIGRMFYKYLKSVGYSSVSLVSRNLDNYHKRHDSCDVLINCTSLGTVNRDSPVDKLHEDIELVIDVSIKPGLLYEQSVNKGVRYFSGLEFYKHQFKKQFLVYTGIDISLDDFDQMVPKDA